MSLSTAAMLGESVLLVVALVFLVALLRSHAEILRRLIALEGRAPSPQPERGSDERAPRQLAGETLDGDVVSIALASGAQPTLLAFLSSGCAGCEVLWEGLRSGVAVPPGVRLLVVTKDASRESPSRLRELGPLRHEVVMSGSAFADFAVPATPHFVLVGDDGGVKGRGSAGTWEQILRLVHDADSDAAQARTSSERAARAEQALAVAGISAGHPSLHPSRREP